MSNYGGVGTDSHLREGSGLVCSRLKTLDVATQPLIGANLGGQGDLVSGLMVEITRVTIWAIEVINLLTRAP